MVPFTVIEEPSHFEITFDEETFYSTLIDNIQVNIKDIFINFYLFYFLLTDLPLSNSKEELQKLYSFLILNQCNELSKLSNKSLFYKSNNEYLFNILFFYIQTFINIKVTDKVLDNNLKLLYKDSNTLNNLERDESKLKVKDTVKTKLLQEIILKKLVNILSDLNEINIMKLQTKDYSINDFEKSLENIESFQKWFHYLWFVELTSDDKTFFMNSMKNFIDEYSDS